MKKLFFSLILIATGLVAFSQTYDVSISGLITDMVTGEPVLNQEINIVTDSLSGGGSSYYNTVTTNSSGYYSDIMQLPIDEQGIVEVFTMSCGMIQSQSGYYSQNTNQLTFDFQICSDSIGDCQAMFYYMPGNDFLSIQFTDTSYGNPDSWMWDFGDGNTSTEQNPVHTFPQPGEYITNLTISGSACTSTTELIVFVMIDTIPTDCQAMYYYYQSNIPNTLQFMDESFGAPTSWSWDFGDGNTSNDQSPEHTYSQAGEYIVTLSIKNDSSQCYSSYEELVFVGDSIWPTECQAMYYAFPDSNNFLSMNFFDMSIVGGNAGGSPGVPETWYWDFGDGNISLEQNPLHTYEIEGEYEVCLTITDSLENCESSFCDIIIVGDWTPDCEAYFWYYPMGDTMNPGGTGNFQNIGFIDASIGNIDSWSWDFGDGIISNEQNPTHYFENQGIYTVCLNISNSMDSCFSTYCEDIYVFNDTIIGCDTWYEYEITNRMVDFQAYHEGQTNTIEYSWSFGDGTYDTGSNVSHTFSEDGLYEVLLSASDSSGCYAEYIEMIWIGTNFTFNVEGWIHLEDSLLADYADVHLMTLDTLDFGLINLTTTQIDENGHYSFEGLGLENCIYFIHAELTETSAHFGSYVPTYHFDAINWEFASPIFPFPTGMSYDVFLSRTTTIVTGVGSITGTIVTQISRETVGNIEIILLDENGNPVKYLRTNDDGVFTFDGLANGTYTVYTEIAGIETIPFDVTLTDQNNSSSVNILLSNGQATLGIDDLTSSYVESVDNIYPNPVTNDANIVVTMKKQSNVKIEILNHFGQVIYSDNQILSNGNHRINLPLESMSQGLYFVKISANDNISSIRKFVKLR